MPRYNNNSLLSRIVLLIASFSSILCYVHGEYETNYYKTESYTVGAYHRTDFCPLHRQTETGNLNIRDALRGQQISVALFTYQTLEELDSEGNHTGNYQINAQNPANAQSSNAIRFLDELARRAGFTWRESFGVLKSPNSALNQTWGGLLDWTIDTYDLMGDWYLETLDRMANGILFPEGWYDGSLIMVRRIPKNDIEYNFWSFVSPFTAQVWYLILATTVFMGAMLYLIDYLHSNGGERKNMELSFVECYYVSFIAFCGHLLHLPKSGAGKILIFGICFSFLLILSAYTANLASFLVIQNQPTFIINEINDAIQGGLTFCAMTSTTSHKVLQNEFAVSEHQIIPKETIGETYLAVIDGECDIVLTTIGTWQQYERNAQYNQGCALEWIGRVVKPISAGFSLRDSATLCSSLLRDVLSYHMVEMKLDREYDLIWNSILDNDATISCDANGNENGASQNSDDSSSSELNLLNLGGIFVLHLGATTIAVLLSIFKWWRMIKRNGTIQEPSMDDHDENFSRDGGGGSGYAASEGSSSKFDASFRKIAHELQMIVQGESEGDGRDSVELGPYELYLRQIKKRKKQKYAIMIMVSAILLLWMTFLLLFYV